MNNHLGSAQTPVRLMLSQLRAACCFRGAMRPTSVIGGRIPVRRVPLREDGRQREQCEIGSQVAAPRRNGYKRLLDRELAAQEQAIKEARQLLAACQHGPRRAAPLFDYWRNRRAREGFDKFNGAGRLP